MKRETWTLIIREHPNESVCRWWGTLNRNGRAQTNVYATTRDALIASATAKKAALIADRAAAKATETVILP